MSRTAGAAPRTATLAATSALRAETVRRLVARGIRVRVTLGGGSMRPLLRSGDRASVAAHGGKFACGDLLVVGSGDSLLIRRFVDRTADGVIFATGDESSRSGVPLAATAIVGRIETVERNGRPAESDPAATMAERLVSATRKLVRRMAG